MRDKMSRATNFVKATYQEVYDLATTATGVTVIGIHTPDTTKVSTMLNGFFTQYRKFKYNGCSAVMIPAAQLPADPLQVSWEAGETIDPRDLLNPILFHGCHGESLNEVLDSVFANTAYGRKTGTSVVQDMWGLTDGGMMAEYGANDVAEGMYYAALSDPSFRKFNVQSGVKLSLRPMIHPVALSHPMVPNRGMFTDTNTSGPPTSNIYGYDEGDLGIYDTGVSDDNGGSTIDGGYHTVTTPVDGSGQRFQYIQSTMFTSGLKPLGWLPTVQFMPGTDAPTSAEGNKYGVVTLPRLFMGILVLPPSYKTELYFRMVLTHSFYFRDFSTSLGLTGMPSSYTNTMPETAADSNSVEMLSGNAVLTTEGVY